MTDRHVVADDQRRAFWIVFVPMRDVAEREILDIRATPDVDGIHVAAQHGIAPDRTVLADADIADDLGRLVQVGTRAYCGLEIEIAGDGHCSLRSEVAGDGPGPATTSRLRHS